MKRSKQMVSLVILTLVGALLIPGAVQAAAQPGVLTRALDNPAYQPFQAFNHKTSASMLDHIKIYEVPAGKRAVIEFFSVEIVSPGAGECFVRLVTNIGGGIEDDRSHLIPLTKVATIENDGVVMVYAAGQTTRLYADPGTNIVVDFGSYHYFSSNSMRCSATVSGYLVDLPSK